MLAPTWKFMGFFFFQTFHLNFKLWIWMSLKFKTLYSFNSIFSYFLEILSFNKRPKGPIAHLRNISHLEPVWAELWIFQQIHSKKYIIALPTSHSWEKNGSPVHNSLPLKTLIAKFGTNSQCGFGKEFQIVL